jgi:hypothetical protein
MFFARGIVAFFFSQQLELFNEEYLSQVEITTEIIAAKSLEMSILNWGRSRSSSRSGRINTGTH